jgi:hypothetical protein
MLVIDKNCPVVVVPENWSEPIKITHARPNFPATWEDMPESYTGPIMRRSAREWAIVLLVCVIPYGLLLWAAYDALKP